MQILLSLLVLPFNNWNFLYITANTGEYHRCSFFQEKIRIISGPLVGLEGNIYKVNKKRKRITIESSLTSDGKRFDLCYEDVELVQK